MRCNEAILTAARIPDLEVGADQVTSAQKSHSTKNGPQKTETSHAPHQLRNIHLCLTGQGTDLCMPAAPSRQHV